jgi:hypothetical protein
LNEHFDRSVPDEIAKEVDSLPHIQEFLENRPTGKVHSQSFSDTNIWFTPVSDQEGRLFSATISRLMLGVGIAHLLALSRGTPCRGGIALACGTDAIGKITGAEEIYGPALIEAYQLESKRADYPRVVVGDYLIKFMTGCLVDIQKMDRQSVEFAQLLYQNTMIQNALSILLWMRTPQLFSTMLVSKLLEFPNRHLLEWGLTRRKFLPKHSILQNMRLKDLLMRGIIFLQADIRLCIDTLKFGKSFGCKSARCYS